MKRTLGPPLFILILLSAIYCDELSETEVTIAPPLPICETFQACSAEISIYPVVEPTEPSVIDVEETTLESILESTTNGDLAEFNAGEDELMLVHPTMTASPDIMIEGSGDEMIESSGQEPPMLQFIVSSTIQPESTAFPFYDEFVTSPKVFNFEAQPNTTRTRLCRCGDDNEQGL